LVALKDEKRCIVLIAAYKGLYHAGRHELDLMTQILQRSRPVLRSAACFHADQTARAVGKMLQKFLPLKLQRHNLARRRLHPMQLKYPLCDIHSNHDTIHLGPSVCL
jgi:hypothetical protein